MKLSNHVDATPFFPFIHVHFLVVNLLILTLIFCSLQNSSPLFSDCTRSSPQRLHLLLSQTLFHKYPLLLSIITPSPVP